MSDKLIIDLLKEVREHQNNQTNTLNDHTIMLNDLRKDVEKNTKDIAEHVTVDKKEHELFKLELSDIAKDVDNYKDDKKALKKLKKWFIGAGALAGSAIAIFKFLQWFVGAGNLTGAATKFFGYFNF